MRTRINFILGNREIAPSISDEYKYCNNPDKHVHMEVILPTNQSLSNLNNPGARWQNNPLQ